VTPAPPATVPLSRLQVGAEAYLHDTRLDGDTREHLRSLGLTDASHLRVCKSGEPFIFQVRTTRIGVSGAVARRIDVVVNGTAPFNSTHGSDRAGA
jgi:Fe2+ transport system protein FeoA